MINEDKMVTSGTKFEFFKLDLEKPQLDSNNITMKEQSQKQQPKGAASTVEKNGTHHFTLKPLFIMLIILRLYAKLSF